jgi:hypothetical protein
MKTHTQGVYGLHSLTNSELEAEPTYTIYMKNLYSVVLLHIRAGVGNDLHQLSVVLDT